MFGRHSPRMQLFGAMAVLLSVSAVANAQADRKAIAVLKAVSQRLAVARSLSFVAEQTSERPFELSIPTRLQVTLRRPDTLRMTFASGAGRFQVDCNGRTMTRYSSGERAFAIEQAPPTLEICAQAANRAAAVDFPLIDLMISNSIRNLTALTHVRYVGSKVVGGTAVDIIAFSRDEVSVELSVGAEDKLPREIVALHVDDATGSRRRVVLSDWHLDTVGPTVYVSGNSPGPTHTGEPHPVGTTGIETVPESPPFTLYPYVADASERAMERVQAPSDNAAPSYQSPDGFDSSAPANATGQFLTSLPAGCATPYPHGPAFYLCGNTWFSAVYGPNGVLYYRVISPP
jgi:hypothetical protein